jgi:sugar phosphate isomerase/epimerase
VTESRQHHSAPGLLGRAHAPAFAAGNLAVHHEFSLAHLTLLHRAPPELIEIAAEAGYDYVSLRPIAFGLPTEPKYPLATDQQLLRRTRAALAATGVRLLDIELAKICEDVDVNAYRPALECAAELGARHVLTSVWCSDFELARDRFIELCALGEPLGLTIDLEFVTYAGVSNLAQAVGLLTAASCPNAGICVDTLHFNRSACCLEELLTLPGRWLHYAQICDAPAEFSPDGESLRSIAREGRLPLGEGGIDVRAILSAMPAMPYSIELPNARLRAQLGDGEFVSRCLQSARRYLRTGSMELLRS